MFECQFNSCGDFLDSFFILNAIYSLKHLKRLVKVLKYFKTFLWEFMSILPLDLKSSQAFDSFVHPLFEVYI